jgi:TniB protein
MTEFMERSERVLVKYPLFKAAIARIQTCFDSHDATAEPDCCPIVGESGSGKTTIISFFASLHPRVDHKWGMEVPGMTVHPEGVVTFGEAAAVLGVSMPVIRGLVEQGILHITAEYRNGFSKLLPAVDVQRFAEGYVATSVLAKRFHLDSGSLARYLKESGTPLLGIPLPDPGDYYAFFLRKDVAAQIQLPSRRRLREEAARRIRDARRKKWAEYRLARETSSGKPMRRQRR